MPPAPRLPSVTAAGHDPAAPVIRPGVAADDLDEVGPTEAGQEVRQHVCVDVPEHRLRPVPVALREALEDASLEVRPRVRRDDRSEGVLRRSSGRHRGRPSRHPRFTSAISGSRNSGTPGVVCSAMPSHTSRPPGCPRRARGGRCGRRPHRRPRTAARSRGVDRSGRGRGTSRRRRATPGRGEPAPLTLQGAEEEHPREWWNSRSSSAARTCSVAARTRAVSGTVMPAMVSIMIASSLVDRVLQGGWTARPATSDIRTEMRHRWTCRGRPSRSSCSNGVKFLDVTGPAEVFAEATVRSRLRPPFVSPDGRPVRTSVGLTVPWTPPGGPRRAGRPAGRRRRRPRRSIGTRRTRRRGACGRPLRPYRRIGVHGRVRPGPGRTTRGPARDHALATRGAAGSGRAGHRGHTGLDLGPGRGRRHLRRCKQPGSTSLWRSSNATTEVTWPGTSLERSWCTCSVLVVRRSSRRGCVGLLRAPRRCGPSWTWSWRIQRCRSAPGTLPEPWVSAPDTSRGSSSRSSAPLRSASSSVPGGPRSASCSSRARRGGGRSRSGLHRPGRVPPSVPACLWHDAERAPPPVWDHRDPPPDSR